MPTRVIDPTPSARERLLASADELFYEDGINSVGIDRVIEHAGVAKATLYNAFGSKDELVRAYLQRRHQARIDRLTPLLAGIDSPRDRVLAIFDSLAGVIRQSSFRGCAFLNAAAEARSGSAVQAVSAEYRGWLRTLFTDLVTEAGAPDPMTLATRLCLLYDGAVVGARMDRAADAAVAAREMAAELVDAAVGASR